MSEALLNIMNSLVTIIVALFDEKWITVTVPGLVSLSWAL